MPAIVLQKKGKDVNEGSGKGQHSKIQNRYFDFLWVEVSEKVESIPEPILRLLLWTLWNDHYPLYWNYFRS